MQEKNEARRDGIRITLRMTPQQRNLLRRAAEVAGVPVSTFVLRSACQAADLLVIEQQSGVSLPTVESLPVFTNPARLRWESIPADIRQRLLSNVWCGQCRHETTITNFSGTIKGGDLLLVGKCAECRSDVARVIEGS
ncbi:Protein of unknown function [Paenacidovorax caeni]|uniref:DUF1778 domain-containing protein n=1 Tax=Paenacidovorax caeni TaxID=343013 RepID=A0A1I7JEN8_9BURK|nr:DUF1778 domain-containing protein [Paenacidovorax caeni]SFU83634.1 Protein of unknown function [Paenacidovorax caeni]